MFVQSVSSCRSRLYSEAEKVLRSKPAEILVKPLDARKRRDRKNAVRLAGDANGRAADPGQRHSYVKNERVDSMTASEKIEVVPGLGVKRVSIQ